MLGRREAVDWSTGNLRLLQTWRLRRRCHRAGGDHCWPLGSGLIQRSLLSSRYFLRLLCPLWRDLRSTLYRRCLPLWRGPTCKSIVRQRIRESLREVLVLRFCFLHGWLKLKLVTLLVQDIELVQRWKSVRQLITILLWPSIQCRKGVMGCSLGVTAVRRRTWFCRAMGRGLRLSRSPSPHGCDLGNDLSLLHRRRERGTHGRSFRRRRWQFLIPPRFGD